MTLPHARSRGRGGSGRDRGGRGRGGQGRGEQGEGRGTHGRGVKHLGKFAAAKVGQSWVSDILFGVFLHGGFLVSGQIILLLFSVYKLLCLSALLFHSLLPYSLFLFLSCFFPVPLPIRVVIWVSSFYSLRRLHA